jgi:glycosyltransferase A (GT-A) superfamily protein (DUF2064 family)
MTTVAVLADPPRPGLALPALAEAGPLSASDAADLYGAMLKDTFVAVDTSGAELLVNYRPDDLLPAEYRRETTSEAAVRALAVDALGDLDDVRFEPQVGSTPAARAGNTVTHLLREEEAGSVAVVRGTAPLLARTTLDSSLMQLRRAPVVLGPAQDGRVHFAAFTDPIDFEGAFADPAVSTLTDRARDAGHDVAFIGMAPVVERPGDLVTLLPMLRARRAAGRAVPEHTASVVDDLGLRVAVEDDEPRVVAD